MVWKSLERAAKIAKEYAEAAYKRGKAPPSHDLDHVVRVVSLCRWLSKELALGARERKLLEVAAWLHDVAIAEFGTKERHAERSAEIAARVLEGLLAEEDLAVVVSAIREHSWGRRTTLSSVVSAALQDADRLDALGAVGLYRVLVYGAFKGRRLYHPEDPFAEDREPDDDSYTIDHFFTKLLRLKDNMNTEPARKEAEKRTEIMRAFLTELRRELNLVSSPGRNPRA